MRFLHTSDWQLGMPLAMLGSEAPRFRNDRIDAVRQVLEVAQEAGCAAVVVAGDVFDSNFLDRQTVQRACEALRSRLPVLLPGNHDPYDPASIYGTEEFRDRCPGNVRVLTEATPVSAVDGRLEVLPAPWLSKRPTHDLTEPLLEHLEPPPRGRRPRTHLHPAISPQCGAARAGGAGKPGALRRPRRPALAHPYRHLQSL